MVAGDKQLRRIDLVERLAREGDIGDGERAAAKRFAEDYFKSGTRARYAASRGPIDEVAGTEGTVRSPLSTMPAGINVPTFPQRSQLSLFTTAACSGLGSVPDRRTRRALLHLS